MGPRLVGRGKQPANAQLAMFIATLQWGRVLWDAERRFRACVRGILVRLQWGRVLWDAERVVSRSSPIRWVASMGPRLVGRGKVGQKNSDFSNNRASMGPRLVGRGKGPVLRIPGPTCLASMGPRLVGRGKKKSSVENRLPSICFNGAASCGTRKAWRGQLDRRLRFVASMGPRLVGRGKRQWQASAGGPIGPASMGPRLVGRGKHNSAYQQYRR